MNRIRGHFATSIRRVASLLALTAATAAIAVVQSGCASEATCQDFGCASGLVCDESSGECVERETGCPTQPCEEGFFCDRPSGECRTQSRSCSTDAECDADRECNDEGVCELPDKCTEEDCTVVETCSPETGDCVPKQCSSQSDCSLEGFICGNEGKCVSGCLVGAGDCPTGQSCREVSDRGTVDETPVGECRSQCRTDAECPCGASCASNTCGAPSSCDDDADCRADEVCRDGKCTCAPCTSDSAQCAGNQVCDRPTGICLGGDCPEDEFAPNHAPEEAADIEVGGATRLDAADLTLCPGRSDWFELSVESAQAVEFELVHDVRRDLDLVVYDDRGRAIAWDQLAPSRQNTASDRFATRTTVISEHDQQLQVRVYSNQRKASTSEDRPPLPESASYDLNVELADNTSCRREEDDREENDSRRNAAPLPSNVGTETEFDLQICNGDLDWFVLPDVDARSQLQTRLDGVAREDDHLRFVILSENGRDFILAPSQALNLIRTGPEQDWYMSVYSRTRQSASYGIRYKIDPPYECPEAGQYGTVENALDLAPRVVTENFLCPLEDQWEVDWIDLDEPQSTARLRFFLEPTPRDALPPLDVTLFEKTASGLERLRPAARTNGGLEIRARIEPSQDLLIRVGRKEPDDGSTPPPGVLELEPNYEVLYEYDPQ